MRKTQSDGTVIVRAIYGKFCLQGSEPDGITTKLSLLKLLQKVRIPYNWVVLRKPVLTHDKLWRMEIHMVSRCYLCGQCVEAVNHLFPILEDDQSDVKSVY